MEQIYEYTLVTALYDIQRDKYDGRSFDDYIEWFKMTLLINEPMIIYLDRSKRFLFEFVKQIRDRVNQPSLIIETNLEEIPCYWMLEPTKRIINDPVFLSTCKYPNDITNKNPLYVCIQYSKFEWVLQGYEQMAWRTKTIGWIDAGISRFYSKISSINRNMIKSVNNILLHKTSRTDELLNRQIILNREEYIGTNECIIKGTIWFANPNKLDLLISKIYNIIKCDMFAKNKIDNEQIALALIVGDDQELFSWIENDSTNHLNRNIFIY
jgi:hypothetical protein